MTPEVRFRAVSGKIVLSEQQPGKPNQSAMKSKSVSLASTVHQQKTPGIKEESSVQVSSIGKKKSANKNTSQLPKGPKTKFILKATEKPTQEQKVPKLPFFHLDQNTATNKHWESAGVLPVASLTTRVTRQTWNAGAAVKQGANQKNLAPLQSAASAGRISSESLKFVERKSPSSHTTKSRSSQKNFAESQA